MEELQTKNFILGNLLISSTKTFSNEQDISKLETYGVKIKTGNDISANEYRPQIIELVGEIESRKQGGSIANVAYTSSGISGQKATFINRKVKDVYKADFDFLKTKAGEYGVDFADFGEDGVLFTNITFLNNSKERGFIYPDGSPKIGFNVDELSVFLSNTDINTKIRVCIYLEQYAFLEDNFNFYQVCATIKEIYGDRVDIVLGINENTEKNISKSTLLKSMSDYHIKRIGLDLDQFIFYFFKEDIQDFNKAQIDELKKKITEEFDLEALRSCLKDSALLDRTDFFITDGPDKVITVTNLDGNGVKLIKHEILTLGEQVIKNGSGLSGAGDTFFGAVDGVIKSGETDVEKIVSFANLTVAIKISEKDKKIVVGGRLTAEALKAIRELELAEYFKTSSEERMAKFGKIRQEIKINTKSQSKEMGEQACSAFV